MSSQHNIFTLSLVFAPNAQPNAQPNIHQLTPLWDTPNMNIGRVHVIPPEGASGDAPLRMAEAMHMLETGRPPSVADVRPPAHVVFILDPHTLVSFHGYALFDPVFRGDGDLRYITHAELIDHYLAGEPAIEIQAAFDILFETYDGEPLYIAMRVDYTTDTASFMHGFDRDYTTLSDPNPARYTFGAMLATNPTHQRVWADYEIPYTVFVAEVGQVFASTTQSDGNDIIRYYLCRDDIQPHLRSSAVMVDFEHTMILEPTGVDFYTLANPRV